MGCHKKWSSNSFLQRCLSVVRHWHFDFSLPDVLCEHEDHISSAKTDNHMWSFSERCEQDSQNSAEAGTQRNEDSLHSQIRVVTGLRSRYESFLQPYMCVDFGYF